MLETLIPGSLLLSFRLTLPFHSLRRSFRFNSSRPFDTCFLSFQRFHPVHVLLPFVSSRSCGYVLPFVSIPIQSCRLHVCFIATCLFRLLLPSFGFNTPPVSSFLPFVSTPSFRLLSSHFVTSVLTFHLVYKPHSLLLPFRFTSYSLFVTVILSLQLFPFIRYTSFLSIQLFPFIRYCLPFVSTLSFHSLLFSFPFTFGLSCATFCLSFHLWPVIRSFLPFVSTLPFIRYGFWCVSVFLSFHLWPFIRSCLSFQLWPFYSLFSAFRCNFKIPFQGKLEKHAIRGKTVFFIFFFKFSAGEQSGLAFAICGHLWPLAAPRVTASGCKVLQVVVVRPLALAAPAVARQIWKKCDLQDNCFFFFKFWGVYSRTPDCHLRPLPATWVAASGCKWLPGTCSRDPLWPLALAAPCGHSRPLEWLQVAAFLKFKYRVNVDFPLLAIQLKMGYSHVWTPYIGLMSFLPGRQQTATSTKLEDTRTFQRLCALQKDGQGCPNLSFSTFFQLSLFRIIFVGVLVALQPDLWTNSSKPTMRMPSQCHPSEVLAPRHVIAPWLNQSCTDRYYSTHLEPLHYTPKWNKVQSGNLTNP